MKKILLLSLSLFIGIHLFGQKNTTKINGTVLNNNENPITEVSLEDLANQKTVSTEKISKNTFSFDAKIEQAGFFRLVFSQNQYLLLALHPNDNLDIKIDFNNLLEPEIVGSVENKSFYSEIKAVSAVSEIEDSVEQIFNSNYGVNDTIAAQAVMQYQMLEMQKKMTMQNFIKSNPSYLVSLYFIEQLSLDEDFDLYKLLADSLSVKYPTNEFVVSLKTRVEKASKLAIGSVAPEIIMPNTAGKEVALSSLRGKYVLVDFWAAWCGPCRRESPNMVNLYEKYNSEGFEIYSVSLDQTKEAWTKAIADDGLGKWTHVSDLKYWQSEAATEYGVEGIPFTVLLDKEGKIIAKNLRGDALADKLAELFGK
jgi:peroxiredoxin